MAKATYRRISLLGLLTVPVSESMTIMGARLQAGRVGRRVGIGAVTETLHLIHKHKAEGEITGNGMGF